ncbi:tetratricopeptide repeat protein, partial [candidate division KSB1 bacterium]
PLFFVVIFVIFLYRKKLLVCVDSNWLFLGISSTMYLLCLAGFNLQNGASRDWDLLSSMTIPLTLFTMRSIFLVKKRFNRNELTILGMFLLVHIIPWLVVNANEGWSLNRFKVMAEDSKWSPEAKGNGFDELRSYCANKGDKDSAYVFAKKAALNIYSVRYNYNWALAAHYLNRFDEAANRYKEVLEMDPNYYNAYLNYGAVLFRQKKLKEALAIYETAKKRFKTADLYYNIAFTMDKLGLYDEAISHYKEVLKMVPNYYKAYLNYGEVLFKKGQFEEALAVCESAKQRFKTPELYLNTALVLEKLRRYSEAIQNVKTALILNPELPDATEFLYQLYQKVE